ncbi:hypothetical protein AB0C47_01600 [Micromonospora taraxaci]|uniref:hypothetical protein n=1 Tax=Micromonospora taraxaci TaxID=1316803 RepID=UPI0033D3AE00
MTPDLTFVPGELLREPYLYRGPGPSTVGRGLFAIDPKPFGAPFVPAENQDGSAEAMPGVGSTVDGVDMMSAGPRDTIVIHPDDAPSLEPHPDDSRQAGCCGPFGDRGPNRVCACGAEVAALMADCYGPHELHLYPDRVAADGADQAP